jgi:hypothetical protein
MTDKHLSAVRAEKVMGRRVVPDGFLLGNRQWIPQWQPTRGLADGFRLLDQAAPQKHSMGTTVNGGFWVKARVADRTGEACESKPRAITLAIARALGVNVKVEG